MDYYNNIIKLVKVLLTSRKELEEIMIPPNYSKKLPYKVLV